MEEDGTAFIRFGDGTYGKKPQNSTDWMNYLFYATYHVGNGLSGNVGSESISRIVSSRLFNPLGITSIRNPIEAGGGRDPENTEAVRQYAPESFRKLKRAVTEEDYVKVLETHPEVHKALAMIIWTGSWYTVAIAIDRLGSGRDVDEKFKLKIRNFLNSYRLAGYDIEIKGPVYVPLHIIICVCVTPNHFRNEVKNKLLNVFSNYDDIYREHRGFFHPDNLTFGQSIYLSQIYELAMSIPGVSSINISRFARWAKPSNGELEGGEIKIAPDEIARLDNDPNYPENGKIEFLMTGGL